MKIKNQLKKALGIFILIFLISCSEEDNLAINSDGVASREKIENVINLNGSVQKVAYRMLDDEEKIQLWKDRLSELMLRRNLNTAQTDFVKELKNTLNVESVFGDNQVEYDQYLNKMRDLGHTLFSSKEMAMYFASLDDLETLNRDLGLSDEDEIIDDGAADCGCNYNDDWCDAYQNCKVSARCQNTTSGCGWWWSKPCDGDCGPM